MEAGGRPAGGGGGGRRGPGGGGGSGGSGSGPGGRAHVEHQPVRTVYVIADKANPTKLKPVQVKVGISDGIYTEITDGLNEGDEVVTGLSMPADSTSGGSSGNPFGGGRGGPGGGGGLRRM